MLSSMRMNTNIFKRSAEVSKVERSVINSPKAPQPIGAYSQAIQVKGGGLLFISGQVSIDNSGNLVGEGDISSQTRQVFENLKNILGEVGAEFANVIEFTTYIVDKDNIQPYIQARGDIYPDMFPDGAFPANTLLVVDALVKEEYLLEIKAIASLP